MILGLSTHNFTLLHVAISLIGIVAGLWFFFGLTRGTWGSNVNRVFFVFTLLTSVTGFLFPIKGTTPALIFGAISIVVLAIAAYALWGRKGAGPWRRVYCGTALFAQWLNMIVLVVQSFQKVPQLHALAPAGSGPAILAAQGLMALIVLYFAWKTVVHRAV